MIKIEPFDIEHFDQMDIDESTHLRRENRELYERYKTIGSAISLLDGDKVLACGGCAVLWDGVGEIWMLKGRYFADHPVSAVRAGRHVVKDALTRMGLRRVQANVEAADIKAKRYIEAIGLCFEGLMRCYGVNGEDYLLYARVE